MIKSDFFKHVLRTARSIRVALLAEPRYQPKPSIRDCVELAYDGVSEYWQGSTRPEIRL